MLKCTFALQKEEFTLSDRKEQPTDTTSSISWSKTTTFPTFATGSWDSHVRIYRVDLEKKSLAQAVSFDAKVPCLGVDWHEDATQVFTGCTSGEVKGFALHRNQGFEIGSHEGIVKDVYWLKATNILCSVSLDRTVRFWDLRERGPVYQFELKYEPLYSDLYEHKLALALSENKVTLVDLAEGLKTKDSQE